MRFLRGIFILMLFAGRLVATQVASGDSDISFSEATAALTAGLETVGKFEIFEGLPHPDSEKNLFEAENMARTPIRLDDQLFYPIAQEGRLDDVLELQRLLSTDLLRLWRGQKLCGSFHADFAVRFVSGKSIYCVLFCFGCHEARIMRESQTIKADIHAADFRLTTDLNPEKFEKLRTLLMKYRKERPARSTGLSSG